MPAKRQGNRAKPEQTLIKILFVSQNFPAQYRHLAAALAQLRGWQVMALGDAKFVRQRPPYWG